ncbi:hypothetical protein F4806DRAFT_51141 [Annulohypoxylon nitens]|nr:hypothetical protein F4806DRAFT_51141 [Annulohypoxylon nitens]
MPSTTILRRLLRRGRLNREKKKIQPTVDDDNEEDYSNAGSFERVSLDDGLGLLKCHDGCDGPSDGIDLVFVHGLRGSRVKTWSKGGVFWPRDFLRDDFKKARIVSWGYDANIANAFSYASQESLFGHANTLLNDLARLRRGITRPIIFVCHSLGGLVIKEALITSDSYHNHGRHPSRAEIYAKTIGIIFMGTPHQGSPKESYGDIVANIAHLSLRQPNKQLLQILRPDSHVLEKQRNDFATISDEMSIVCLREELPTGAGIIVPGDSAWYISFKSNLDSLHANHMDMVRFSSRDENYRKVLGYIEEIRDGYVSEEDNLIKGRCNEILDALRLPNTEQREDAIEDAYANTCSWILENDSKNSETNAESCRFLSWLANDKPFFWISGKAGCGKSTLMKYMYHDERTRASLQASAWTGAKDLILIGHFFCDRGDNDQKSREGMFRNILHQILRNRHKLIQKCFPALFKKRHLNSPVLMDEARLQFRDWDNLTKTFFAMLDYLQDTKVCLFLDGLDEYRMVKRSQSYTEEELDLIFDGENEDEAWGRSPWITDGHREIARFIRRLGDTHEVKICLSSRELNVFEHEFRDFPRIRVHEETTESIIQYCQGILTKATPDLDGLTNFVSSITEKSCGVFLWVRIVVDMLIDGYTDGNSEDELRQVLNTLPRRLGGDDGLYVRMMQMVKREYLPESKRLFQLVSLKRKMDIVTLFFAEQWHLENGKQEMRAKTEKLQPRTWDELQPRWKALEKRLKSRCGGLLEGTKEVKFMHQTAKEFISREYLKNKIFQDAVGFFPASNAYIASMSGGIRRLKCCAESIVTPDMLDVNPHINNISVNPFKDVRVRTPNFRLMDFILGHANSMASSTEIEGDACRFYIELLDELNHVSSQLVVSLKDSYADLSFSWCDVYIQNVSDLLGPQRHIPRVKSFLQLTFLYKLTPYVEAKVKGQGIPRDELEFFLLQLSCHSDISWWGDGFFLILQPVPRIFEMLFLEGADPNFLTDPQNNETAWMCHLKCVKSLHQTEMDDLWGATTRLFLKFGADPGVRVEPKHVTSGIDVGGDRDDEGSGLTVEDIIREALAQKPQDLFETLKILDESREGWQNDYLPHTWDDSPKIF